MLKHAAAAFFCLILIVSPLCALPAFGSGQDAGQSAAASSGRQSGGEAAAESLKQARQALSQSGAALQQAEQRVLASRQDDAPPMTEQERNILLLSDSDYLAALGQYNAARFDYDEAMAAWEIYEAGGESAPFELEKAHPGRPFFLPSALVLLFAAAGAALFWRRARRR